MTITLDLSDELMSLLAAYGQTSESGARAVAWNLYRKGTISTALRQVLGLDTRLQVYVFLKEHGVPLPYIAAHDLGSGDSIPELQKDQSC